MQKIVTIGDVHGRDHWKKIVAKEADADMFVFIGDYYDTPAISPEKVHINFREILEFKRANPDKVTLLIGNHDLHYMACATQKCSGYNEKVALVARIHLEEALKNKEIQVCYRYENFFFSHAGITEHWLAKTDFPVNGGLLVEYINDLFYKQPELFEYQKEDTSGYGEHIAQSPMWVRPESLKKDVITGMSYVIGHTTFPNVFAVDIEYGQHIIFTDAPKSGEYFVIENNEGKIKTWHEEKRKTS